MMNQLLKKILDETPKELREQIKELAVKSFEAGYSNSSHNDHEDFRDQHGLNCDVEFKPSTGDEFYESIKPSVN